MQRTPAVVLLFAFVLTAHAQISGVTPKSPSLSADIHPKHLTVDGSGNVWFCDWRFTPHSVGYFQPDGMVHSFPVPCDKCATAEEITYIHGLAAAPDGSVWFPYARAKSDGSPIDSWVGRFTAQGVFSTWKLPTTDGFRFYQFGAIGHSDIAYGPDGNVWFTENSGNKVGKITPNGTITEYPLTGFAAPSVIVAGPDGNLWFTESGIHKIAKMTTAGNITEYPLAAGTYPIGLTVGADGNLWFAQAGNHMIGRITTAGAITTYPLGAGHQYPMHIERGPDDALWFTLVTSKEIGRLEPQPSGPPEIETCQASACTGAEPPGCASGCTPFDVAFAANDASPDPADAVTLLATAFTGAEDVLLEASVPAAPCPEILIESDAHSVSDNGIFAGYPMDPILFYEVGGKDPVQLTIDPLPSGTEWKENYPFPNSAQLRGPAPEAGNYSVTVRATDARGCTAEQTFSFVVQPTSCHMNLVADPPWGLLDNYYSGTIRVIGGLAPYSFELLGGAEFTLSGALLGAYAPANDCEEGCEITAAVRVTDARGCSRTDFVTVHMLTEPPKRRSAGH